MLVPIPNSLDTEVKALVDYCVKNNYLFSCWDLTRQLRHHYQTQETAYAYIDHNNVRSAVEAYFFDPAKNPLNSKYVREVTYTIHGAPQIYFNPAKNTVNDYDKDFLDPLRVENPKPPVVKTKTLSEKVKEEEEVSKTPKVVNGGAVYALKHKTLPLWVGKKYGKANREEVTSLNKADFWPTANSPTQILKYKNKNDWELVRYEISYKLV